MDDVSWLDQHIAKQTRHWSLVTAAACAVELFGDDELERFAAARETSPSQVLVTDQPNIEDGARD